MAHFAGSAHWAELSPPFVHRAFPSPLNCKNEYLVLVLGEETAVQAVVGSIVWAFGRLKKPRSWEMSARSYALSFFPAIMYKISHVGLHFPVVVVTWICPVGGW